MLTRSHRWIGLSHEAENRPLATRQVFDQVVGPLPAQELGYHEWIDRGPAVAHAAHRIEELIEVREPILEQIADAIRALAQEVESVVTFYILRQHQDTHLRMLASDPFGGHQPLVGL